MARNTRPNKNRQNRQSRPSAGGGKPRRGRPKFCVFCRDHAAWVDYKDVDLLRRFMTDRGRIKARGATGACAQHQRDVATAVKTARELVLLPYLVRTIATEPRGGRGGDRRGNSRGVTGQAGAENTAPIASADAAVPADDPDEPAGTSEPSGESITTPV